MLRFLIQDFVNACVHLVKTHINVGTHGAEADGGGDRTADGTARPTTQRSELQTYRQIEIHTTDEIRSHDPVYVRNPLSGSTLHAPRVDLDRCSIGMSIGMGMRMGQRHRTTRLGSALYHYNYDIIV